MPGLSNNKPSTMAVMFFHYLKNNNIAYEQKKIVDIGCGKGRNTIYLAQQGFSVFAFDYIEIAIHQAKKRAEEENIANKIHFSIAAMDLQWNFPNNFFDFAIDRFSSIDVETKKGRETYKKELLRTLKPGGYALICVVSVEDEVEAKCIQGPEKNSVIWPNGKFQKNYDEVELKEFYKNFSIIECKKVQKKAVKLNQEFTATNYWLLLQKPIENIIHQEW